ncbi:replication terminator protein [Enterococcus cecorum]|uniref:replication terminator protein n=1 Tax=Enterococcus cecorum TaxID=44008 RepID=UPI002433FD7D|nr:replication terminator protein [Enterococcus cecorum]
MADIEIILSKLSEGAVQQKLDGELEKVFNNIHDLNTEAKKKRAITITLEFTPDEKRQVVNLTTKFSTKLAPVEELDTTILTDKDLTTGLIAAKELKSNAPGQTYIDMDGTVKTDVGEPIDVIEKEELKKQNINNQIIDLKAKRG